MTENAEDPAAGSRLRAVWARLRNRGGADRRDAFGEPWMLEFQGAAAEGADRGPDGPNAPPAEPAPRFGILVGRDAEPAVRLVTELPIPNVPRLHADDYEPGPDHDGALVAALHRVADSFERIATSLDADRRERRSTLDDIDSLLRALVGELRSPAAVVPVVVAGSIDTEGARVDAEIDLTGGDGDTGEIEPPPGPDRRPFERTRPR